MITGIHGSYPRRRFYMPSASADSQDLLRKYPLFAVFRPISGAYRQLFRDLRPHPADFLRPVFHGCIRDLTGHTEQAAHLLIRSIMNSLYTAHKTLSIGISDTEETPFHPAFPRQRLPARAKGCGQAGGRSSQGPADVPAGGSCICRYGIQFPCSAAFLRRYPKISKEQAPFTEPMNRKASPFRISAFSTVSPGSTSAR